MLLRIADQGITLPHRLDSVPAPGPGRKLAAVVLLAGTVRANPLRRATGRGALRLPVGNNRSVLDCWKEQLVSLAESLGQGELPVRVIVEQGGSVGRRRLNCGPVKMTVEQDPAEFRGTGGLLSDLAEGYHDDEQILVIHASRLLFAPLSDLVLQLMNAGGDVAMLVRPDHSPGGIMRMCCGSLRLVNKVGFVDLNEQALPLIAKRYDVRVARYDGRVAMSLRTLDDYLEALREYHCRATGRLDERRPFGETWKPTFAILEGGAAIHERAVIHDSVVLSGARVDNGAVVVRSVVCPGAVVGPGERAIDCLVTDKPVSLSTR